MSFVLNEFKGYMFSSKMFPQSGHQAIKMKSLHPHPLTAVQPIPNLATGKIRKEVNCFCKNTSPVFNLASIIGLNITTTKFNQLKPNPVEKCEHAAVNNNQINYCHSRKLLSFSSVTNILFLLTYIYLTVWVYLHLGEHLGVFFRGVDYYTLAVDVVSNFAQATFLLLYARLKGRVLLQALHEIQSIYEKLKDEKILLELPKKLKSLSIYLVAFILTITVLYGTFFLYIIFVVSIPCIDESKREGMLTVSFVIEKFGHFFMPLYSQTLVSLFIVCTEFIRQLYIHLAEKLKQILVGSNKEAYGQSQESKLYIGPESNDRGNQRKLAEEVEACRLMYYRLYRTVGTISHYFGGSLLVICCISVISLTATIYTAILYKSNYGLLANELKEKNIITLYFLMWAFHLFFAFFNLGGVLCSGQRVTYASQRVSRTIQETVVNHMDKDTKFQISLLSQAVYGDPVEISACSITKMSMTFLASACGNIITYILVLLQFRLSCSSE